MHWCVLLLCNVIVTEKYNQNSSRKKTKQTNLEENEFREMFDVYSILIPVDGGRIFTEKRSPEVGIHGATLHQD